MKLVLTPKEPNMLRLKKITILADLKSTDPPMTEGDLNNGVARFQKLVFEHTPYILTLFK